MSWLNVLHKFFYCQRRYGCIIVLPMRWVLMAAILAIMASILTPMELTVAASGKGAASIKTLDVCLKSASAAKGDVPCIHESGCELCPPAYSGRHSNQPYRTPPLTLPFRLDRPPDLV